MKMRAVIMVMLVALPSNLAFRPRFTGVVQNVTIQQGREAVLSCAVENLRTYKVAWVRVDTQTILTIHYHVITRNPRVSLTHHGHSKWHLHIADVTREDSGAYMCQINTDPMMFRTGHLQVVVPPWINDSISSADMIVNEGQEMNLVCRAFGYPPPRVQWRREDGTAIQRGHGPGQSSVTVVSGQELNITRVSRLDMGAYLCIASNGVLPAISKRLYVKVHFGPVMLVSSQLESAYVGQRERRLQCETEAFPRSINYWTNGYGEMITAGKKYEIELVESSLYQISMILIIRNIEKQDFQKYKCVAKNSLGEVDGVISLDEEPAPTTFSTTRLGQQVFTDTGGESDMDFEDTGGDHLSNKWYSSQPPDAGPFDHPHIGSDSGAVSGTKYTFEATGNSVSEAASPLNRLCWLMLLFAW